MISDEIFDKKYDFEKYNCFHFLCEMHPLVTGIPLDYKTVVEDVTRRHDPHRFKRLLKPKNGAIALFRNIESDIHVGIIHQGKVLHIQEGGVKWQNLQTLTPYYRRVGYYEYTNC